MADTIKLNELNARINASRDIRFEKRDHTPLTPPRV